ncbi:MAG: metalloregulator ArsR/SmtB family transcription factor [Gemmatimonadaceae bacterium]
MHAFDVLGHPVRRRILEMLASSAYNSGEIVDEIQREFDISQPAVSQHLAALKQAGLVHGRRQGRLVYYRVEPKGLKPLVDWIAHYRAFWTEHVERLEQLLDRMDG